MTEWPEFTTLSWAHVATIVRGRIIVDGRNALDPDALIAAGFVYTSFGRGRRDPIEQLEPVAMPAREERVFDTGVMALGDGVLT